MKLTIRLTPNARTSQITQWKDEILFVRVHAPAKEGKANAALIELLAASFRLPKTHIHLLHGLQGRTKIVEIPLHPKDVQSFFASGGTSSTPPIAQG